MSSSPIPVRAIATLAFPEAMQAVIDGRRISKLEWEDTGLFAELRGGFLMILLVDGWRRWTISDGDMMGNDWLVL